MDVGSLRGDAGIVDEHSPTRLATGLQRVGDVNRIARQKPYVAVDAAMIAEVETGLGLTRRKRLVVAVVGLNGHDATVAFPNILLVEVDDDWQIAAKMPDGEPAVDVDVLLAHDGLEVKGRGRQEP